jgi:hypothetical protein
MEGGGGLRDAVHYKVFRGVLNTLEEMLEKY